MIIIKILNGPYEGQTRSVSLHAEDPLEILTALIGQGWRWELDYSRATEEEEYFFGRADLVARIIRALREKKTILFPGTTFRVREGQDVTALARKIEDAFGEYLIGVESDDENGLVIKAVRPEDIT